MYSTKVRREIWTRPKNIEFAIARKIPIAAFFDKWLTKNRIIPSLSTLKNSDARQKPVAFTLYRIVS